MYSHLHNHNYFCLEMSAQLQQLNGVMLNDLVLMLFYTEMTSMKLNKNVLVSPK